MNLARDAVVRSVSVIALSALPLMADLPASSAMAQEAADSMNLSGVWKFDNEVVDLTHGGTGVRAEFLDGAECFDGQVRPYFLDGVLSGTSLTGSMMVCSRSPDLIQSCGISSMYETTFEATVEAGRIAGTRVAQGLAVEEEGGITSCRPDSQYDGTYPFEGTLCNKPGELEDLLAQLDSMTAESNRIADELHATPSVGPWFEEGYAGPNADLATRWRAIEQQMLQLVERINATQDAGEKAALQAELDALAAELGPLEDELSAMNVTDWTRDDYIGPNAELAARWHALEDEMLEVVRQANAAEERRRECEGPGEDCPSAAEVEDLLARLDSMTAESNRIADELHATPSVGPWFEDGYAGPNADLATRWRVVEQQMLQLVERINATQDAGERATLQAELDALAAEMGPLEDELSAMNATDWTRDDYIGPNAELAARWHALEDEMLEVVRQANAAEERRRECAEAVG